MGLLSDIFQQQQNLAKNPTSAIRTPKEIAYDNLLNKQYDIEKQNKKNNILNNILSGAGGLGKIVASATIKNPYEKAGAIQGISEQEQRLDNLRQAYENIRQAQNKDYIAQAQQQLDTARQDEDKNNNKDMTNRQFAYKKAQDLISQSNAEKEFDLKQKLAQANIDKINTEIKALKIQPSKKELEELEKQQKLVALEQAQENLKKTKRENSPEYLQQKKEEERIKEENNQIISMAKDLFSKKQINGEQLNQIVNDPQKFKHLENRNFLMRVWRRMPFTDTNALRFVENKEKNNDFEIMTDKDGNKAKVYKDGRIEEI